MFPTAPISPDRLSRTTDIASALLKPGDRLLLDPSARDDRTSEPCAHGFGIVRVYGLAAAGSLLLALALVVLTLIQLRATRADKAGERAR